MPPNPQPQSLPPTRAPRRNTIAKSQRTPNSVPRTAGHVRTDLPVRQRQQANSSSKSGVGLFAENVLRQHWRRDCFSTQQRSGISHQHQGRRARKSSPALANYWTQFSQPPPACPRLRGRKRGGPGNSARKRHKMLLELDRLFCSTVDNTPRCVSTCVPDQCRPVRPRQIRDCVALHHGHCPWTVPDNAGYSKSSLKWRHSSIAYSMYASFKPYHAHAC